ncbi:hypothetical protein Ancab_025436 [Ancistrocladus abbreviatus]
MGMEVAGSDLAQVNVETVGEENKSELHAKENGEVILEEGVSEPIKFGSYAVDEPTKGGATNSSNDNMPKNATDEWPDQQIHHFYFVKYRPYDDPILKPKIEQADMEFNKMKQQRTQIINALQDKRSVRSGVIAQLKSLTAEKKQYNIAMDEKRNVMKPLQEALGSLRGSNNPGREKGVGVCSSEEELNELIQSLHYRMVHESISLTEEKQVLREIKQLEGTREQVIANAAVRARIQDSLGQKETIQEQVKLMGSDLDGVRKERETVRAKIKDLEDELKAIDKDIAALEKELRIVDEKKGKAAENLSQLRKRSNDGNACFDQNRNLLSRARGLALRKDIKALEELSHVEVDKFISLWSSSKAFRDDYEKRILLSLDMRQLSRDGRMRNPDEKPLVRQETSRPMVVETVSKPNPKPPKEDVKHTVEQDNLHPQKVQKESKKKAAESKTASEHHAVEEETFIIEKPQKDTSKDREIDPAKLKEMKREEEMAKQRLALERKKKLAEKAAAKAATRAQKEAEKKQKELIP